MMSDGKGAAEGGFVTVAGWIGMAFLLLLSACLYRVVGAEMDAEGEFLAGMQAESLAHAGAVVAIVRLKNDREFQNQLESGMINSRNPFMTGRIADFEAGRYDVYAARREDGACLLLSLGTVGEARRQVLVEVRFDADGFSQIWNDY